MAKTYDAMLQYRVDDYPAAWLASVWESLLATP